MGWDGWVTQEWTQALDFAPPALSGSCKYSILTTKPLATANCTGFQKQEIGVFKAEEVFRFGVVCQKGASR